MGDTRLLLHQVQHHVGTAQLVLDEVGKGLATVERAEVVAERAVPVLRTVFIVAVGLGAAAGVYLLVARRARRNRPAPDPPDGDLSTPSS